MALNTHGARPALKANSVGLSRVVFQSVTHMAPAVSLVFVILIAAGIAGPTLPIVIIIALVAMLPVASSIGQLAREIPSAGGLYGYVTVGLGPAWGFFTGWLLLAIETLVAPVILLLAAVELRDFFNTEFGINVSWVAWVFLVAAILLAVTFRDVKMSMGVSMALGVIELALFAVFSIWIIVSVKSGNTIQAFNPAHAPGSAVNGTFKGVAFATLALLGYESAAPFGEEAKDPRRTIPRALIWSVVVIGGWYVLTSYAWIVGIGFQDFTNSVLNDPNPLHSLGTKFWGAGWVLLFFALINGVIANGTAAVNTGSRVIYSMSRAGLLPNRLAALHPSFKTPHIAIVMQSAIGLALALIFGAVWNPFVGLGIAGALIGVLVLIMYIIACLTTVVYFRSRAKAHTVEVSVWRHRILPVVGGLAFMVPLYYQFVPLPAFPARWANWLAIAWIAIGIVIVRMLTRRNRQSMANAASAFVEVEADRPANEEVPLGGI